MSQQEEKKRKKKTNATVLRTTEVALLSLAGQLARMKKFGEILKSIIVDIIDNYDDRRYM